MKDNVPFSTVNSVLNYLNTKLFTLSYLAVFIFNFCAISIAFAQKPNLSYNQTNYSFSKGMAITPIAAPNNSGGSVPLKIRGAVEESFGISEYRASKIAKSSSDQLVSLLFDESKVQRVDLSNKRVTSTLTNRDKPWAIVKDSQGNIYWTEPGTVKIVSNAGSPDASSFISAALPLLEEADIPIVSDAITIYNGVGALYSLFSGGGDLTRKITGQDEGSKYKLQFSGKIYKLAPGQTTPTTLVDGLQVPTGLAIDAEDNLYASCYTANYTVKGGVSFSGGEMSYDPGESQTYDSKIVKITTTQTGKQTVTDISKLPNINYPTQIGIDANGNFIVMYNHGDNMEFVSLARVNKYPAGQVSGTQYTNIVYLCKGGTKVSQNLPIYQDMVVDAFGNLYLCDFYQDKIWVLPANTKGQENLQVFSEQALSPNAMYVDLATNQLWVKEGKYVTTSAIKKLSLYGYSVSPSLPTGLILRNDGVISGTPSLVSAQKEYTVSATNAAGASYTNIRLQVGEIARPAINYATTNYNLIIDRQVNLSAAVNTGGSFNQQIGPLSSTEVYKGSTKAKGIAFDQEGNMYFAETSANRIMKVDTKGVATVYLANITNPTSVAIDRKSGIFYFSQDNPSGSTLSSLNPGFDRPTELIKGGSIQHVAIDGNGDVYVVQQGNGSIYKFSIKTVEFKPFVTNLTQPYAATIKGDFLYVVNIYGKTEKIALANPSNKTLLADFGYGFGISSDDYGNIFVASADIMKIAANGTVETFIPSSYSVNTVMVDNDNNIYGAPIDYGSTVFRIMKYTAGGYQISPALPSGLTFNANGTITGIPTSSSASKEYTVTAENPLGKSTAKVNIAVSHEPIQQLAYYNVASVLYIGVAKDIKYTPDVTGGKVERYSVTPALSAGLSLNTTTGEITGTPTAYGAATSYTIKAENAVSNKTAQVNFAVTLVPPTSVTYTFEKVKLDRDVMVDVAAVTTGGKDGLTYTVSPNLPQGLSINASTGKITGTPTQITAKKTYRVTVANNGGSAYYDIVDLQVFLDAPNTLAYSIGNTKTLLRNAAITPITISYKGPSASGFTINKTLPAGLSFDTRTGTISGTPTALSGNTEYTITASNDGGSNEIKITLSVYVIAPTNLSYVIAAQLLKGNAIGEIAPSFTGGVPTQYAINKPLPVGLSFNTATGVISGTPTAVTAASEQFIITATNDGGSTTYPFNLSVYVQQPSNLAYNIASSLLRNAAFASVTPTYNGSQATSFAISPTTLPRGLSFSTSTGVISGTPDEITPSPISYTVTATNEAGSTTKSFTLSVRVDQPTSLAYTLNAVYVRNQSVAGIAPTVAGNSHPVTYSVSPALPAGLTLNASTGVISGTPTQLAAATNYDIKAKNDGGEVIKTVSFAVVVNPPSALAYTVEATYLIDKAIANITPSISGHSHAVTYTVSPTLPSNLTLNASTGVIAGTPNVKTSATAYTITATNEGGSKSAQITFAIRVDKPEQLNYQFVQTTLLRGATIPAVTPTYTGSRATSFTVSPTLPTGLSIDASTGVISGTPSELSVATNYTVTANNVTGAATFTFSLTVTELAPEGLTYAFNPTILTQGVAITPVKPAFTKGMAVEYTVSPSLPSGLTINSTTGVVGGTPLVSSPAITYTVRASNTAGFTDGTFSISVVVLPASNLNYNVSTSYLKDASFAAITPTFTAGSPVTFSSSPSLPSGLTIDANTGVISGTPNAKAESKTYLISATNAANVPATKSITFEVRVEKATSLNYSLAANSSFLRNGTFATLTPTFGGNSHPVTFNCIPALPAGLVLNTTTGVISGTPTAIAPLTTYVVSATNEGGSATAQLSFGVRVDPATTLTYAFPADIYIRNTAFPTLTPTFGGYSHPVTFDISPSLPAGLNLNNITGVISGTPTAQAEMTEYTITATNDGGSKTFETSFAVKVNPVTTLSFPIADSYRRDFSIDKVVPTYSGNSHPVTFTLTPALPAGLNFNPVNGEITGTPTAITASKEYTLRLTNDGGSKEYRFNLGVRVDKASILRYHFLDNQLLLADRLEDVIPKYYGSPVDRFSISPNLPQGLTFDNTNGAIAGRPVALSPETSYTVTAENDGGTATTTFLLSVTNSSAPQISYGDLQFKFTKDVAIQPIATPTNTGGGITPTSMVERKYSGISQAGRSVADVVGNVYISDFVNGFAVIKKLAKGADVMVDYITEGLGNTAIGALALDAEDNIYYSTGNAIYKVTPQKAITLFDGNLSGISSMMVDRDNDLYVSEYDGGRVVAYTNCTATLKTTKISGLTLWAMGGYPPTRPVAMVVDSKKSIYILISGTVSGNTVFGFVRRFDLENNYQTYQEISSYARAITGMTIDKGDNVAVIRDGGVFVMDRGGSGVYSYGPVDGAQISNISFDKDLNLLYTVQTPSLAFAKRGRYGFNVNSLPAGLTLKDNGSISGTPTALSALSSYTVTATTARGNSSTQLKIEVVDALPTFNYAQKSHILTKGVTLLNITPTKTGGAFSNYVISPTVLPQGITFNTTTGAFSGTIVNLQDTASVYTVSATNTGGKHTETISISVIDKAPGVITYANNYSLTKGKQFTSDEPVVVGGTVTTWTVTPQLPAGLTINQANGVITGYPEAVTAAATYSINGSNSGGQVSTQITLTVKDLPPSIYYSLNQKRKFRKDVEISPIATPDNIGGPIVNYTISSLPDGLTFNSATGEIAGTPTRITPTANYTITANGGQWGTSTANLEIEIISMPPNDFTYVERVSMVRGQVISPIAPSTTSTGGDAVDKYTITPELPTGLTINATTGVISGTPNAVAAANTQLYYIKAENGAGAKLASIMLTIKDFAPAISYNTNLVFTKEVEKTVEVTSTAGAAELYKINPALPEGLALDSVSGSIYGSAANLSVAKAYTITATNYNNPSSTSTFNLSVVDQLPSFSYSSATFNLVRNVVMEAQNVTSTGGAVISYAVSPVLPTGLSFDTETGTISGKPTISTVAKNYVITATNSGGSTNYTLNIAVKNAPPIIALANTSHLVHEGVIMPAIVPTSTGGDQIVYSIQPSNLPAGLSFNATTGAITGTPTTRGNLVTYTITATNDGGTATVSFTLKVDENPPGAITYSFLNEDFYVGRAITNLTPNIATGGGVIANYTLTPSVLPNGLSFNAATGVISGIPTTVTARNTYLIKAVNSGGTKETSVTFGVTNILIDVNSTNVSCHGSATGAITTTVSGGTAPYTYTWNNSLQTVNLVGLVAGSYTLTVTDANQFTATKTVVITQPLAMAISNSVKINNTINAAASGAINLTVTGGTTPYTYAWSNGATTNAISGLVAGNYTLVVTDANNCTLSQTYYIDEPTTKPTGLAYEGFDKQNKLTWNANPETDVASYKIYGGLTQNTTTLLQTVAANVLTFTYDNLVNGTNYYYRIKAVDTAGLESAFSDEIVGIPRHPQAITFAAITDKVYGDADITLNATTNSALPIVYTSDNTAVATIVNGKIKIVGAGSTNISATQGGNILWLPAETKTQQLNVAKRVLTITAVAANKVYDGNVSTTVTLTDNRIAGDDITVSYNSAAFEDKNVGQAKRIAVFGVALAGDKASNYAFSEILSAQANITHKTLTISADDKAKVQSLPLPILTVSYNGFVANETHDVLTTQPLATTIALADSPQGTYPITVAGASASNYTIVYVPGVLTIQPGVPTDVALAKQILFENKPANTIVGKLTSTSPQPNNVFTYSLVNGDGDTDNDKFVIDGDNLSTKQSFDYEMKNEFTIRIKTTNQYGLSFDKAFTIAVADVNEAPTLDAIENQTICYTSTNQNVALSGITAGPENGQQVNATVTSSNAGLFSNLTVGAILNGNATLNYRVATGQSGTATITVRITDSGNTENGGVNAVTKTFTVTVNPLPKIVITSKLGTTFSKGLTTTLTATGGVSYKWTGPAGLIGDRNSNVIEVRPETQTADYTVEVTTASGCTSVETITLNTEEDLQVIKGTNIITPNGDGVNDNLIIRNADLYPNNELRVFDRSGRLIYQTTNYKNEWSATINGLPLAEGTYYYIIDFKTVGKYKGFITIVRN